MTTATQAIETYNPVSEKDLRDHDGKRMVDIVMGRDDGRTHELHYLVIERPWPHVSTNDIREIEQYGHVERLVANALDLETGDRHGKWLGAFTGTFRDGKLVAVQMIENMPVRLAVAKHNKLSPYKTKNRLVEGA